MQPKISRHIISIRCLVRGVRTPPHPPSPFPTPSHKKKSPFLLFIVCRHTIYLTLILHFHRLPSHHLPNPHPTFSSSAVTLFTLPSSYIFIVCRHTIYLTLILHFHRLPSHHLPNPHLTFSSSAVTPFTLPSSYIFIVCRHTIHLTLTLQFHHLPLTFFF